MKVHLQTHTRKRIVVCGGSLSASNTGKGGPKHPEVIISPAGVQTTEHPRRILVVEDNLDSVHSLAYLLADMGHTVEYAINGYVAVEAAKHFRPDVVLLDLGLPGIDGFEVCRRLKRDESLPPTKIIALTAFSQDEYRARAKALGIETYLVKPVELKVLEDALG